MRAASSANPADAAERAERVELAIATARRTASARWVSGRDGTAPSVTRGDVTEEVVEGPDRAREQRRTAPDQVTLDAIDVDAVRDDEPGIALEHVEVALQEQRDLAGVRRPDDERESHRSIVVPASGASFVRLVRRVQRA